ncbi:MAG TPA: hypothetical protein VNQ76_15455 [Planctomicrobium sp.]|nr:hypothetical protein [Planctomicrobium sp.]
MATLFHKWRVHLLLVGMMMPICPAVADDAEGVVRLGRNSGTQEISPVSGTSQVVFRGQSPEAVNLTQNVTPTNCEQEVLAQGGVGAQGQCQNPNCRNPHCPYGAANAHNGSFRSRFSAWLHGKHDHGHVGHRHYGNGHHGHGHNGNHRPEYPLAGKYHIVYPADPSYFDNRDGQVYAAAGYGGPVSVPLAPVVNHTYNYGWGIPSSRLTPVLHPASQAPIATMPASVPSAPISW